MGVFENIKKNIQKDVENLTADGYVFEILDETDNAITVFDDTDGFSREYTLVNPDIIDSRWIREKIVVTDSAKRFPFHINEDKLVGFVNGINHNMLMTLENIIIMADSEEDYDYLSALDSRYAGMLETNDLPDENLLGLMWYSHQIIFINLGSIIKTTKEMLEEGILYGWEETDNVNRGVLETVVHEIRHLAQANPYLPKELLKQEADDEMDAERYAQMICGGNIPYILD